MRLGLDVSQHQLEWPELLRRVRFAEEAGFDGAWVFDHFKPLYGDRNGPCLEGWTFLAAEAVTVDQVSGGRLELAVGAAWFEGEHRELGIPFPPTRERTERLEEAVQVIRLLMTEDGVTFEGKHYRLEAATYHPRPFQQPHPPIWIGAGGERRTIPIAARHADVWHSFGSVQVLRRKAAVLDRAAEAVGRDPVSIVRATDLSISEPWEEVRERVDALGEAGFTYLVVSWPSEGWGRVEEFVGKVMPEVR